MHLYSPVTQFMKYFQRIIVILYLAMKSVAQLAYWLECSLFQVGQASLGNVLLISSLTCSSVPALKLQLPLIQRDCTCSVCLHLALGAAVFLGRESHAMHTQEEAVREAVVALGYSSPIPEERGWALKLGRYMFKPSMHHFLTF